MKDGAIDIKSCSFTVFDVETTGLYPYSGDRICEIGAVRFSPGKRPVRKFTELIDPQRPISPGAFSVNGITDGMVRGKPTIDKIMPAFLRFIDGSVLVAYNAGFDLGFLEASLGERKQLLDEYHVIDALSLARRLFPGVGRYNLGSVARALGISTEGEHRAMADAMITLKIFRMELEALEAAGVTTIENIAAIPVRKDRAPVVKLHGLTAMTSFNAGSRSLPWSGIPPEGHSSTPSRVWPSGCGVKGCTLALIEAAISRQRRLNIVYRSSWNDSLSERAITPKRIHRGYDRTYVVAHCHMRGSERNFRLDCIVRAEEEPQG
jgi:DNA polymerase III epsilon subunit family exonuclease